VHPTIKLLNLIILAVILNLVSTKVLLVIALALLLMLMHFRVYGMISMIFRLRWLLLSLMLVYVFNTPGEYLQPWPFTFTPTYEGLQQGGLQILRLCLMMAGLTLLTATTNRQQIMVGFYVLLQPLKLLKLSPERFAARLWLTLYYVEHRQQQSQKSSILDSLKAMHMTRNDEITHLEKIELTLPAFTGMDVVMPWVFIAAVWLLECWLA
jgi:energy-coupling factor transporter transmembrane protein EcfT